MYASSYQWLDFQWANAWNIDFYHKISEIYFKFTCGINIVNTCTRVAENSVCTIICSYFNWAPMRGQHQNIENNYFSISICRTLYFVWWHQFYLFNQFPWLRAQLSVVRACVDTLKSNFINECAICFSARNYSLNTSSRVINNIVLFAINLRCLVYPENRREWWVLMLVAVELDRKSTRLNSSH